MLHLQDVNIQNKWRYSPNQISIMEKLSKWLYLVIKVLKRGQKMLKIATILMSLVKRLWKEEIGTHRINLSKGFHSQITSNDWLYLVGKVLKRGQKMLKIATILMSLVKRLWKEEIGTHRINLSRGFHSQITWDGWGRPQRGCTGFTWHYRTRHCRVALPPRGQSLADSRP